MTEDMHEENSLTDSPSESTSQDAGPVANVDHAAQQNGDQQAGEQATADQVCRAKKAQPLSRLKQQRQPPRTEPLLKRVPPS